MTDIAPTCTCYIASGLVLSGDQLTRIPAQGARDAKGRPVCQVHFPVDNNEWVSRASGGKDDGGFNANT